MKITLLILLVNLALAAEGALSEDIAKLQGGTAAFMIDRNTKNNYWNSPKEYDLKKYKDILALLLDSKEWDGKTGAAAYGMLHAHPPGLTIALTNTNKEDEIGKQQVTFCYGNRLCWIGDHIYLLSDAAGKWMDNEFPGNKSGG